VGVTSVVVRMGALERGIVVGRATGFSTRRWAGGGKPICLAAQRSLAGSFGVLYTLDFDGTGCVNERKNS
jgi:hypothetical protein